MGLTWASRPNLWLAADKMRNNMDAAEYKYVVLGLIFLKKYCAGFSNRTFTEACGLSRR